MLGFGKKNRNFGDALRGTATEAALLPGSVMSADIARHEERVNALGLGERILDLPRGVVLRRVFAKNGLNNWGAKFNPAYHPSKTEYFGATPDEALDKMFAHQGDAMVAAEAARGKK